MSNFVEPLVATCRFVSLLGEVPRRLGKFLLIGGTGVIVNNAALVLLYQEARFPLVVASALATEIAVINNFIWNDRWTFHRASLELGRFLRFNLVSLGGLIITAAVLWGLVQFAGVYYLLANVTGIAAATAWNFGMSVIWTWGDHP